VDEKKHADGKDEHEWAAEQPQVQVQIAKEPVKSPSHPAGALSKSENQSSPWKHPI
jgi:hypothetical protein